METLIEIGKILLFILFWVAGLYIWGSVKNRRWLLLRQLINFWTLKKWFWLVAVECLATRGNSASLQFPRFALLFSFLGFYRAQMYIHLFQIYISHSCKAVNRCSGFLRALQSSSICNPIQAPLRSGVAYASVLCVTKNPSSWEYIFQPFAFPSRLKKYTPTCCSVPLVGLGAWIYLVRVRSAPAGFFGMQSHSCSKFPHRMPPA